MPPRKTVDSQRMYEGRVVSLRLDTLELEGGQTVQREIVEHRGAIVIAALDAEGGVLMVRQYRHPTGESLLELPAGTLEPGEDPLETAVRELQEETGFFPGDMRAAGGFYSAPGFCNEFLHFFVARDLRPQKLEGDEDEDIEVEVLGAARASELILSGEIRDAKTIAGLYILELAQPWS